ILYPGIQRIDRKDHLFYPWVEFLQTRPAGVSNTQFRNRLALPQPLYPTWWTSQNAPGAVPPLSRDGPVPWSTGRFSFLNFLVERGKGMRDGKANAVCAAGCSIMLIPILKANGEFHWDTGRYKSIAGKGVDINSACVRPAVAGGRGIGGLDFVGMSDPSNPSIHLLVD
ncbi:MAG: hypothetical protein Q9170_007397, partial [Blastenia crenularia]